MKSTTPWPWLNIFAFFFALLALGVSLEGMSDRASSKEEGAVLAEVALPVFAAPIRIRTSSDTIFAGSNELMVFPDSRASKTTSGLIPKGAALMAVMIRVIAEPVFDTCASINIGDGTDVDLFGAGISVARKTTTTRVDYTANFHAGLWHEDVGEDVYAPEVTITSNGGNCAGLIVDVMAYYETERR